MFNYFKLIRPYGILFLGLTPVFGAVCNGEFDFLNLLILLIIGFFMHIFTFVQNDYYDFEIDKKSKYVLDRPLASGDISKKNVLIIIIFSFIIPFILSINFFFSWASFFVLILTFFLVTFYNRYSKKKPGMEYILGLGVFTFGIFGALTISNTISHLAIIISLLGFMQWLFSVGISANLKDVKYDSKMKIRTTPIIFSVRVIKNKIEIPISFKIYAFGIKLIHLVIATIPFLLMYTSIYIFNLPIPLICFIFLSIFLLYSTYKILKTPIIKRDTLLRYEGVHEGLALLLIPIVLLSYLIDNLSLYPTIFLFIAIIIWPVFSIRMLYGKNMIPLE